MKRLKEKMLDYEINPPPQSWPVIASALDKENSSSVRPVKKYGTPFYVSIAAAAVTILFLSLFIWINNSNNRKQETAGIKAARNIDHNKDLAAITPDDKITVPKTNEDDQYITANPENGSRRNEKLNKPGPEFDKKKYITISGPQGQPVRISSKVVSLIISSDDQYPPNTVWNAKVDKWKAIMKANTLAPTTANFLDIVELTHALKINNP